MTGIAKVLLGLALGLPMGAYAVGTLVSSSADEPVRRPPIILEDPPLPTQGLSPGATLEPSPDPTRTAGDDEEDEDDDGPEVVVPSYADRDDDDREDDDRDDRDDDDERDGDDD